MKNIQYHGSFAISAVCPISGMTIGFLTFYLKFFKASGDKMGIIKV